MDTTIFLAQIWGPVLLAIGVGMSIGRAQYLKVYKDIESEPLAGLGFGVLAMAAGLAQIAVHNTWDTLPAIIVTLLGWGAFVKGALFLMEPKFVGEMARTWVKADLLPLASAGSIIIGAYLMWFGYLG